MTRLLVAAEALTLITRTAQSSRLEPTIRARVNAALDQEGLDGNRSFQTIGQGLAVIGQTLSKFGLTWDAPNMSQFQSETGQRTVRIASVSNSVVRIGWFKHPSGYCEITAYLS